MQEDETSNFKKDDKKLTYRFSSECSIAIRNRKIYETKNFKKLFSTALKNLRNQLNLPKGQRIFEFDSLLKKVKARFFRTIQLCIKSCLVEKLKIKKLPQKFVTDIKIQSNKKLLNCTLEEIYFLNKIYFKDYFTGENLKKFSEDKLVILKQILASSYSRAFEYYLQSYQYEYDLQNIKTEENETFYRLFSFTAENFIIYYRENKGNIMKKHLKRLNYVFFSSQQ